MITFPNAKINLGLQITGRLSNGYHTINTGIYPIPLRDVLEAIPSKKTSFESSGTTIPGNPKDNLILKAYKLLKKDYHLPELTIHLLKSIPMGAGLGGGSADASFMLNMLNEEFQLFLDDSILEEYAAQLGSDCPFFIRNQPAIATGTGTDVQPIDLDLSGYHLLVLNPGIHISTKDAYAGTSPAPPSYDLKSTIESKDFDFWKKTLANDFEKSVFQQYPELGGIKAKLYDSGALYAAMSGSGSTLFGIFSRPADATDFEETANFIKAMPL
ncbi:4-(cytidine 5'-diphospho)-2-C-methyl-D-erythritol kinase [Fabibacter sp. E12]|nr:4-(cytidine 5'-diphospho)-2-C-methyl-D-erythritol kinase [Roseivirga sp. E12]MBO3700473.1 4-(cytidine 5'-diphospho)-2-C-methyl-D-erythritol kinase [Roseivirga sp. E12]